MPKHAQGPVTPHTIVTLPNTNGMQLLLCYDNEGVYVNTYGKVSRERSAPRQYQVSLFQSVISISGTIEALSWHRQFIARSGRSKRKRPVR